MRIAGINFDHFHMGDLLRMAHDHPDAELVAICDADPERMSGAIQNFSLRNDQVFIDPDTCLEETKPDLVILCPSAARHAEWTEKVAPHGVHILMEKPFASSLDEADRMIAAMAATGKELAINWPLRWVPSHVKAHQLIREGRIGQLTEVHYYDGNRGPLYHGADKIEHEPTAEEKDASWFYKQSEGGGSLFDYLGYGATLGTWFFEGKAPLEISCIIDQPKGLEVDEHSITVARYDAGLSKFETRWGTFTDPWTHQPQPKCGFVFKGTEGTLSSYDYEPTIRLQTRDHPEGESLPAPHLAPPFHNPLAYMIHCLQTRSPIEGPLSPLISRIGQQITDTALQAAQQKQTLPLLP
jgi:predicted dehydrogenase